MYPHPPSSQKPTNYYWILVSCLGVMLVVLFMGLRTVGGRLSAAAAHAPLAAPSPSQQLRQLASAAAEASSSAAPTSSPSVGPTPTAGGGVVDVDPKTLTDSYAQYRSKLVRVRGTVFYTGKLADGKTWIQIVGENNVYVDGQTSEPLPAGVAKGVQVELTGVGAGLTSITASNGKDYDQAFLDPVQKIEIVK